MIKAHLNGGPYDDQYKVVTMPILWVARTHTMKELMASATSTSPVPVIAGHGRYEMRLDGLGQPVPHNLDEVIEYDWKGWDR